MKLFYPPTKQGTKELFDDFNKEADLIDLAEDEIREHEKQEIREQEGIEGHATYTPSKHTEDELLEVLKDKPDIY